MAMIKISPNDSAIIQSILSQKGLSCSVRIEIRSSGCCDASLGLMADTAAETDLTEEIEGLKLVMRPALYALVGEVSIRCAQNSGREEFIVTSEKPLNEWEGFAGSTILS